MSSKKKESALAKYKWPFMAVIILAVLAIFVFLILRSSDNSADNARITPPPISGDIDQGNLVFLRVGLAPLANCDAVLNYYKENALKEVTPWGLRDRGSQFEPWSNILPGSEEDRLTTDANESQSSSAEPGYSTTNIQVEGVDEADIVKTDGDYIYVLSNQALKIVDIRQEGEDNPPSIIAEVGIGFHATDMLLSLKPEGEDSLSDTLIIVGREGWNQLRLVQVNIDDRESPEVTADFTLDGDYAGIRLADNIVRLVTTSQPLGFEWETPAGSGLRAEDKALEANKEVIRNSELSNWVPAYKDNLQEGSRADSLIDCSQMLAPHVFSGLNTLSIMAFNASEKLDAGGWQAIGLAADGQDIYATADHVYVATAELIDEVSADDSVAEPRPALAADLKTIIHKFGIERRESGSEAEASRELPSIARPIYMASGEVAGTLLNQFSMDEYQGDLRVAVTIEHFSENTQENHIKVLRPEKGILEEIGTISGLGIDEIIFAVRFMGPQAYIVTFRQIDPLYALDLSDPANPKTLGELKITGFSSYLHPVGENLLLGVGQEADQDGTIEGLQISLFDTSDPTDPRRVDQLLLDDILDLSEADNIDTTGSSSPVERDHRAFLFYENSAFIPYDNYWFSSSPREWGSEAGILVIEVKDGALSVENILKAVRKENNDQADREMYLKPIRTIVVDGLIYGITSNGELITWRASTGELLHLISY